MFNDEFEGNPDVHDDFDGEPDASAVFDRFHEEWPDVSLSLPLCSRIGHMLLICYWSSANYLPQTPPDRHYDLMTGPALRARPVKIQCNLNVL